MANTVSAEKRVRSSRRKRERNRIFSSMARTHVGKARRLIAENKLEEAEAAVLEAISALDSAAIKGIIDRNNAARRKSRLMRRLNQAKLAAE